MNFLKELIHIRKNAICTIFGIIFIVYFLAVSMLWGRIDIFNVAMMVIGFLWIIISVKISVVLKILKRFPKVVKITFKIFLFSFILTFIIIEGVIIYNMRTTSGEGADYILILGCQVNGSIPSLPLMRRANTATNYLRENRNTNVVVTGGKGPGENISEAEAMKRMLLQNGIEEDRIFEEQNAGSTMENLKFSNELYKLNDKSIIIVSSDYHMFRALSMAKKLNYKNVKGLPCESQLSMLPAYTLREYAAVVYYMLLRRI
jgi:uncharacterized SAM-binding protein YcdF (DUF218 family)